MLYLTNAEILGGKNRNSIALNLSFNCLEREDVSLTGISSFVAAQTDIQKPLTAYFILYPARGRGPTVSSGNVQQSNTWQRTCIYCQQTGHTSSDCRSQFSGSRNNHSRAMNMQSGMTAKIPKFFHPSGCFS